MGSHSRSGDNPPPQVPRHDPFTWTGPATPAPDPTREPVTTAPVVPAQAPGRVDQFAWSGPAVAAPQAATAGPQPGWAPAAPGAVAPYAVALAQRKRRLPVWAIVVIAVVGGFFLLMVVAAVAIPVFLNQRDAAVHRSTAVFVTGDVSGMPQSNDPANTAVVSTLLSQLSQLGECGCMEPSVGSGYADLAGPRRVIVVGTRFRSPMHAAERADFVRNFWAGARRGGAAIGLPAEQDAGALGGTLSCATANAGRMCIAIDAGAYVMIVDLSTGGAFDDALPAAARESIEHRT